MADVPVPALVERAAAACAALASVAESVQDEWPYLEALTGAWRARLEAVAAARRDDVADAAVVGAVDEAIAEAGRVSDPQRALDWCSTLPQVILLALGERP